MDLLHNMVCNSSRGLVKFVIAQGIYQSFDGVHNQLKSNELYFFSIYGSFTTFGELTRETLRRPPFGEVRVLADPTMGARNS